MLFPGGESLLAAFSAALLSAVCTISGIHLLRIIPVYISQPTSSDPLLSPLLPVTLPFLCYLSLGLCGQIRGGGELSRLRSLQVLYQGCTGVPLLELVIVSEMPSQRETSQLKLQMLSWLSVWSVRIFS